MSFDSIDENEALIKEAVTTGIRHIGIAVYSSGKIQKYLMNKGYSYSVSSEAVKRIVNRGYIDDVRAGRKVVNARVGKKQESKRLIYQRLINDGVSKDAANQLVSELQDDKDTCVYLYEAFFPAIPDIYDDNVSSQIIKKALQRGYSNETATIALKRWYKNNSGA